MGDSMKPKVALNPVILVVAVALVMGITMIPVAFVSWISGVSFWLLWGSWWLTQAFVGLAGHATASAARGVSR